MSKQAIYLWVMDKEEEEKGEGGTKKGGRRGRRGGKRGEKEEIMPNISKYANVSYDVRWEL